MAADIRDFINKCNICQRQKYDVAAYPGLLRPLPIPDGFHILRAQQRMKDLTNKHRSYRSFEVGDWVYLKLQPYRQVSATSMPFNKLVAKYYGPYPIDAKVEVVAYKLLLPADVLIHHTFHVSQLKKYHEVHVVINHPPVFHLSSPYCPLLEELLAKRMVKKGNKVDVQVMVKWTDIDRAQATWEYLSELQHIFPSFRS
ncbi:uncharacterized protein [Nicotiana tomentosiformis]|uniref:uncharacterized protein n=1 Tax=Nicotiana tomentosiformis TaxID=4098 RepID=UPI00388CA85F